MRVDYITRLRTFFLGDAGAFERRRYLSLAVVAANILHLYIHRAEYPKFESDNEGKPPLFLFQVKVLP